MSFLPITASKSLGDTRIACVFFLVLERKSYASFLSYFRTVPKGAKNQRPSTWHASSPSELRKGPAAVCAH